MAAPFSTIEVAADEGVLTITLNRPDVLNAFDDTMSVELAAALGSAQRDAVRCVVLTGAGRAFCAGLDLKELAAHGDGDQEKVDFARLLRRRYHPIVARLRSLEKPVIAAVNGVAAGGGASLALACDLRLFARGATLEMAFARLGLVPDMGATLTLVQHTGYARAAEMCLLGEPVSAEDALACGLANRIVDDELLETTTAAMAARLASLPPRALGLTKRALAHAWTATLDQQLEYEAFLQQTAGRTADHQEALAAFLEKRKPVFGRRSGGDKTQH